MLITSACLSDHQLTEVFNFNCILFSFGKTERISKTIIHHCPSHFIHFFFLTACYCTRYDCQHNNIKGSVSFRVYLTKMYKKVCLS